jgi:hypothetical protein
MRTEEWPSRIETRSRGTPAKSSSTDRTGRNLAGLEIGNEAIPCDGQSNASAGPAFSLHAKNFPRGFVPIAGLQRHSYLLIAQGPVGPDRTLAIPMTAAFRSMDAFGRMSAERRQHLYGLAAFVYGQDHDRIVSGPDSLDIVHSDGSNPRVSDFTQWLNSLP